MSKYEEYLNKNKETINESMEYKISSDETGFSFISLNYGDLNKEKLKPIVELLNSIEESKNSIKDWSDFISKWKSLEIKKIERLIAKQYNP